MSLSARSDEPPNRPACARCLITSVGTRTAQAAISPSDDARECVKTVCCQDTGWLVEEVGGRRYRLMPSYTMKKLAADGAEPKATEGRPA